MSSILGKWGGLQVSTYAGPALGLEDRRMVQLTPSSGPVYQGRWTDLVRLLLGEEESLNGAQRRLLLTVGKVLYMLRARDPLDIEDPVWEELKREIARVQLGASE